MKPRYIVETNYTHIENFDDIDSLVEHLTFTPRAINPDDQYDICLLYKKKYFPTGLLDYVHQEFPGRVIDKRTPPHTTPLPTPLKADLYDFQKRAVDTALKKTRGVLHLPVSSGKTYIAIEIFRRLGLKTLYLVPRNELMIQSATKLRELISHPVRIGLCGDSIVQDGDIVFASVFSAHNLDLTQFKVILADECHRAPMRTYYDVIMKCINGYYRIGLTGTVSGRYDGLEILGEACIGPVIYSVGYDVLKKHKLICDAEVVFLETLIPPSINLYSIPQRWRQRYYSRIERECIVLNTFRNNQIKQVTDMFKGKTILIFVKRVEHGKRLHKLIPDSLYCDGSTSLSKRMKILEKVDGKVLISTSIFEEGIDLKVFDVILLAGGGKSVISLTQKIGRGLRYRPGKKLYVIDFLDIGGNNYIENLSRARLKHLQSQGFNVRIQRLPDAVFLREMYYGNNLRMY